METVSECNPVTAALSAIVCPLGYEVATESTQRHVSGLLDPTNTPARYVRPCSSAVSDAGLVTTADPAAWLPFRQLTYVLVIAGSGGLTQWFAVLAASPKPPHRVHVNPAVHSLPRMTLPP